jgi:hypothetical protein
MLIVRFSAKNGGWSLPGPRSSTGNPVSGTEGLRFLSGHRAALGKHRRSYFQFTLPASSSFELSSLDGSQGWQQSQCRKQLLVLKNFSIKSVL